MRMVPATPASPTLFIIRFPKSHSGSTPPIAYSTSWGYNGRFIQCFMDGCITANTTHLLQHTSPHHRPRRLVLWGRVHHCEHNAFASADKTSPMEHGKQEHIHSLSLSNCFCYALDALLSMFGCKCGHGHAGAGYCMRRVLTVSSLRKAQIICFEQAVQLNPSAVVINFPSSHKGHMLQVAMCNLQGQAQA